MCATAAEAEVVQDPLAVGVDAAVALRMRPP